ncbi:hypothetical protein DXA96_05650 [Lachnospiraceae bacterium OF09-33XD]|nr:hypothetical protein DXA96_05650 [Lachnospiraceae bacterium OF09-33XD]
MRAMKKWLSLIGAAAMAFSLTILPGAEKVSAAPPEASVTVGNVTGEVGETVTIPVTFTSAAKDVQGFQANFDYDESVLEFESGRIETEYTSGGNVIAQVTKAKVILYATLQPDMVTDRGTVYLNFKVLTCGKPAAVKITNLIVGNNLSEGANPADVTSTVTINHPADKQIVDETTNPATCTTPGTKVVTCGVCGTEISRTEIQPLGHDEGTWTVTKEAICGIAGSRELHCTRCGELLKTEKIPATGKHTVETWTEVKADCTNPGTKSGVCTVCGQTVTEPIPALGHTWIVNDTTDKDGWKVVTEATAEKEGSKERVCSVCGETETAVLEKLTPEPTKKPTATPGTTQTPGSTGKPGSNGTAGGSTTTNSVKTGDNFTAAIYVAVICAAALCAAGIIVVKRRKSSR